MEGKEQTPINIKDNSKREEEIKPRKSDNLIEKERADEDLSKKDKESLIKEIEMLRKENAELKKRMKTADESIQKESDKNFNTITKSEFTQETFNNFFQMLFEKNSEKETTFEYAQKIVEEYKQLTGEESPLTPEQFQQGMIIYYKKLKNERLESSSEPDFSATASDMIVIINNIKFDYNKNNYKQNYDNIEQNN